MNKSIRIYLSKSLKLQNVLMVSYSLSNADSMPIATVNLDNFIKSKGVIPIGPCIQKTEYVIDEGEADIKVCYMRQTNSFINNIELPYTMKSVLLVRDCVYARYTGPEEKLKLAYDKINVTAFEENIELSNTSYTIFVDKQDDNIVADIFVEKKTDE